MANAKSVGKLLGVAFVVGALTFVGASFMQHEYRTTVRLLLAPQYGTGIDPYNLSKATEYFTDLLSRVVPSQAFFEELLKSEPRIDQSVFSVRPVKRDQEWRHMMQARPVSDTGILELTVYHKASSQASLIGSAAAQLLIVRGALFHGADDKVALRILDAPLTSERPVRPQALLSALIAFLVVFLGGVGFHTASRVVKGHEEHYFLR